jgi:hypothetical protein
MGAGAGVHRGANTLIPTIAFACAALALVLVAACAKRPRGEPLRAVVVIRVLDRVAVETVAVECESLPFRAGRHLSYPTVDVPLHDVPELEARLLPATGALVSAAASACGLREEWLWVREQFLARYSPSEQAHLERHTDASLQSFVLVLSGDFEGGGTVLEGSEKSVKPPAGNALIFCGRVPHAAAPVTSGVRFILAGFIDYHAPEVAWAALRRDNPTIDLGPNAHFPPRTPSRPYCLYNIEKLRSRGAFDRCAEESLLLNRVRAAWPNADVGSLCAAIWTLGGCMRNSSSHELAAHLRRELSPNSTICN